MLCPENAVYDNGVCVCEVNFFAMASQPLHCHACPPGTACDQLGVTLAQLPVRSGYWRVTSSSIGVISCPFPQTCNGSSSMPAVYEEEGTMGCSAGTGARGVMCTLCEISATKISFMDEELERCIECVTTTAIVYVACSLLIIALIAATIYYLVLRRRAVRRRFYRLYRLWRRFRLAATRIELLAKLKLLWSFYQIVCENYEMLSSSFSDAYASILSMYGPALSPALSPALRVSPALSQRWTFACALTTCSYLRSHRHSLAFVASTFLSTPKSSSSSPRFQDSTSSASGSSRSIPSPSPSRCLR